ncbi:MAG: hypothetical protein CMP58_04525 [Flavobacteriales bacterium]|nr:hypothetical protein [Flavobacteriales bacterium]|tara:strand:+ start:194 stop:805 length:612 start_codon:yes stop_codon:yes gene_type:complete
MSTKNLIQLQINEENKILENGDIICKAVKQHPDFQEIYCLYLEDKQEKRILPVVIGSEQANSIIHIIANKKTERPNTHEIFVKITNNYKINLTHVIINKVKIDRKGYGVFYSKMFFENKENNKIEIDSRTSDAVAMACKLNVPIYCFENVMKEASYNIKTYKNKKEFKSIKELEKELELCIKSENYEQASIIRDEIQNIKNEF